MVHSNMYTGAEELTIISKFIGYIISSSQSIVARQLQEEEERQQINHLLDEALYDLSVTDRTMDCAHCDAQENEMINYIQQETETDNTKNEGYLGTQLQKDTLTSAEVDTFDVIKTLEGGEEYIQKYIEDIIKEASEKVLRDLEGCSGKTSVTDTTEMKPSAEEIQAKNEPDLSSDTKKQQNNTKLNKKKQDYEKLLETLARDRSIQKALESQVEYDDQNISYATENDQDDLTKHKYFVAVNCNTKQKKTKGPLQRLGKSIRNFFSCTSVRSADVT